MTLKQNIEKLDVVRGDGSGLLALLIYTHKDAELIKCLRDTDYWNALDEISGDKIAMVVPRLPQRRRRARINAPRHNNNFHMMIEDEEPPEASLELLDWLGLAGATDLPQLVFFVIGPEENEVHVANVKIAAEDMHKTFQKLKTPLQTAAKTIAAYHKLAATTDRSVSAVEALRKHFEFRSLLGTAGKIADLVGKWRGFGGV